MKNIINDASVNEWFAQQMASLTPMKMVLALAFFRLRTPNTFLLVTHYDAEVEPEVMDFIRRIKVQRLRSKTVTPGGVELTVEVQLRERFDIVNKLMDTEGVHNATLIACQSEAGN